MGKVETGDLDKLIAAVEAGTSGWYDFPELCEDVWGADCGYRYSENVRDAFCNGSLDAAKRLHDALLPGWTFDVTVGSAFVVHPDRWDWSYDAPLQFQADNADPARAWLLSILKALKAKGEA